MLLLAAQLLLLLWRDRGVPAAGLLPPCLRGVLLAIVEVLLAAGPPPWPRPRRLDAMLLHGMGEQHVASEVEVCEHSKTL